MRRPIHPSTPLRVTWIGSVVQKKERSGRSPVLKPVLFLSPMYRGLTPNHPERRRGMTWSALIRPEWVVLSTFSPENVTPGEDPGPSPLMQCLRALSFPRKREPTPQREVTDQKTYSEISVRGRCPHLPARCVDPCLRRGDSSRRTCLKLVRTRP